MDTGEGWPEGIVNDMKADVAKGAAPTLITLTPRGLVRKFGYMRRLPEILKERDMAANPELLDRITVRADIFGGKPIIRDMRIAVEHVLGMLAAGDTAETVLKEYPALESEDILACLLFAHRSLAGEQVHERMTVR